MWICGWNGKIEVFLDGILCVERAIGLIYNQHGTKIFHLKNKLCSVHYTLPKTQLKLDAFKIKM